MGASGTWERSDPFCACGFELGWHPKPTGRFIAWAVETSVQRAGV